MKEENYTCKIILKHFQNAYKPSKDRGKLMFIMGHLFYDQ